jgi:general secretion pathway protein G
MDGKSGIANRISQSGFTLLELIITLAVLAILVMGTIPIAQNSVKRQKEVRLRELLRDMRTAIDEFHRDTIGACQGGTQAGNLPDRLGGNIPADPRSRVVIDDCKGLFKPENLDRYPPTLDVLVEGVKIKARGLNVQINSGLGKDPESNVFKDEENEEKKKVYLRELPVDPMTGEKDWKFRSSYQTKDEESWDEINVFDVRSSSDGEALNGEKYSDW